ncbi:MAG: nucleotidyltransferase domain-containing protein [Candidatus Aenigmarchaeota archaeon]|nr:nucleotidyltransferase domain-containing protein [Candidatus Aenigmarchaeota archaeon]
MIRKDIKETIRGYFFINPGSKLRVRQIEKTLKLPLPSVIRYCKDLKEEGILTTTKTGDVVFYTSNRTNEDFLMEKKLFNLKQIHASGIVDWLRDELSNPTIILFGSYSKGEDTENSDIDLYLETPSKKNINVEKFEKILQRKIQVFRHKNIREIGNTGLVNNIVNGIVLNGFIEVFK